MHGGYLRALARKLCRNHIDSDDLVQDLLEKTMRSPEAMPEGANERAWLSRVLNNLFIDKLRRRNTRREEPAGDLPTPLAEDNGPWWRDVSPEQIRAAVRKLPEDQRVTFEMFTFEGASYDAIAAKLGIAKGTVGVRISRARQRLREILSEERDHG